MKLKLWTWIARESSHLTRWVLVASWVSITIVNLSHMNSITWKDLRLVMNPYLRETLYSKEMLTTLFMWIKIKIRSWISWCILINSISHRWLKKEIQICLGEIHMLINCFLLHICHQLLWDRNFRWRHIEICLCNRY